MKWILGMVLSGGMVVLAMRPVPCEVQANIRQPAADFIVDADTAQKAQANRVLLESKSGLVEMPAGKIVFDQMPKMQSGIEVRGAGAGRTTLTTQYTGGGFPLNCSLGAAGTGIGHVDFIEHRGRSQVWCAASVHYPVGTLVYAWVSTNTTPSPVCQRRIVTARDGNLLTLDSGIDPRCNCLKWFADASAIDNVSEGTFVVTVARGTWAVEQSVLVTSGPSVANEALGELRTVTQVMGTKITLDRPLRRGYTNAALAKVSLVENVTLRDLVIDLPVNKQSEALYASLARNWVVEKCRISRMALGNCADIRCIQCDIGWVQCAASSHDVQLQDCRIQSVAFEEGCHDCTIDGCKIGPVQANMNCVSIRAQSERITVRDSHLLGGLAFACSQILMDTPGRECAFSGLRMSGPSPCWLKGDRMRLSGILSEGDITVTGTDPSFSQVWGKNIRVW